MSSAVRCSSRSRRSFITHNMASRGASGKYGLKRGQSEVFLGKDIESPDVVSYNEVVKLMFIADIVGQPGRRAVKELLPSLRQKLGVDLVVANGENAAGGSGIT